MTHSHLTEAQKEELRSIAKVRGWWWSGCNDTQNNGLIFTLSITIVKFIYLFAAFATASIRM
jgi:hypothetical protein